MSENDGWEPGELAALAARLEFGSARVVDDHGVLIVLAGGLFREEGTAISRNQLLRFENDFMKLVAEHGLSFSGTIHLAVPDELDGGPDELDA